MSTTSQQAGPCSVPKFTSTSFTVKHLLIKNQNINQSKSSLLIWHYVSYLFLYINCFSQLLYLPRAREIFHVSRVSWLPFTLYTAEILYIWWKRLNKKNSVDTHKAEKGKWDRMPRWCLDLWIHPLWFILWRHWGLRQRRFPPPVPIEAQQKRARTQRVRAAWRSISQKFRR